MKWCPFCGAKMKHGVSKCAACDKSSGEKEDSLKEKGGLTNLDSYQNKTIPMWVFAIIVGIFLVGLALVFVTKQ